MTVLEKFWKTFERKSPLEKFNLALLLRDKPEIDDKSDDYRAMLAVLKLRNALTHFKPEWSHAPDKHQKLSKELESYFSPSPIFKGDQFIFPMAWAGHSCTSWAVQTAVKFIDFEVLAPAGRVNGRPSYCAKPTSFASPDLIRPGPFTLGDSSTAPFNSGVPATISPQRERARTMLRDSWARRSGNGLARRCDRRRANGEVRR